MVDGLVEALDEVPPGASLTDVLTALTRITVAHRASGVCTAGRRATSTARTAGGCG